MGTSLTGLTPATTYDALIKVADNGPLDGTLKTLSDGLGNDSALALSTGSASITGTLAVSGNVTLDTTTLVVDASGDRVIMGAGSALQGDTLEIHAKSNAGAISLFGRASDNGSAISFRSNGATTQKAQIYGSDAGLGFATGTTQRMLIDTSGNVGIGITSVTDGKLVVAGATSIGNAITQTYIGVAAASNRINSDGSWSIGLDLADGSTERIKLTTSYLRMASGTGGIQFNGDTAAANALDDYEEGTFTPVLTGTTTSPTVTYAVQQGSYTKIGRQVTVCFEVGTTAQSGGVGSIRVTGLPFTVGVRAYNCVATYSINNSTAAPMSIFAEVNATASYFDLLATGDNTTWVNVLWTDATSASIYVNGSFTYFV